MTIAPVDLLESTFLQIALVLIESTSALNLLSLTSCSKLYPKSNFYAVTLGLTNATNERVDELLNVKDSHFSTTSISY